ncbi:MAG: hypothetical protein US70_C0005G0014 [Parcubacteria group bacterium GW2011_GWD2_38_11]|nr:MAG: hypothetical protein US70_C0005G0014 [Parcubacteria group bacterium GW2011_GWD2_38_11]
MINFRFKKTQLNNLPTAKFNRASTKKGSALAMTLVMVVIVAIILTSLLGYISSQIKYSKDRVERERAFQVAEAGAYYYRWYLAHKVSGKTAAQIEDFWANGDADGLPIGIDPINNPYIGTFNDSENMPVGEYELNVVPPEDGSTIVTVTSTGWTNNKPNIKRTVQVRFRRPSWSEYTFLSNSFLHFGDQSTVYGKIHSNDGIRFDGLAYNVVSSAKARFDDTSIGGTALDFGVHTTAGEDDPLAPAYPWPSGTVPVRSDIFIGGREFPVPEVSFSGVATDLDNMKVQAQAGNGQYFGAIALSDGKPGGGRRITLKSDGTYDVCAINKTNKTTHSISKYWKNDMSGTCDTCSGTCVTNYPIINNGVIFVEDNIWVEGSINNKRVTIAAANLSGGGNQADIYIGIGDDNLRLAAYDCVNMLGLVAQRDIRILNSCPEDFIVDAALLAQTGLVGIVGGTSGTKNSLTFNGAISSYLQTFFFNGTSGFDDRTYNFNNKLLDCPPPYFPTGTEYAIDLWDEL